MAPKSKVVVSTAPAMYRPSSNERRAARLAEIAGKQGELKAQAAERRAKRAAAEAKAKAKAGSESPPAAAADTSTSASQPDTP